MSIVMERLPISKEGFVRLEAELKQLKTVDRPAITQAIAEARAHGDLSENAEYHSAREKQSFIEGRISDLEDKVARAEVIDIAKISGDTVKFGATITVVDDDDKEATYQILGEYEADINKNRLSLTSPIARALIGKTVGDYVEVTTPGGSKGYEVLAVKYV
jgi:transcription elongation factor GreA